jgi:hypothetical protein
MFPHELLIDGELCVEIKLTLAISGKTLATVADLQWKSLVDSLASSSNSRLSNCIAVADVSGSMGFIDRPGNKKHPAPIVPCIALTLLLGELAAAPWNGAFITFSTDPSLQTVDPTLPLSARAAALSVAQWQMSTNFNRVFDLILSTAKRYSLKPDEMVKKIFVFSDMQFDAAHEREGNGTTTYGKTEHDIIKAKFAEAGYVMPEMVYWNLSQSGSSKGRGGIGGRASESPKPVKADERGVTLISGWSGALMKYFLSDEGEDIDEGDDGVEDDELENEWEKVDGEEAEGGEGGGDAKVQKQKRARDPRKAVLAIVGKECFADLKIVD